MKTDPLLPNPRFAEFRSKLVSRPDLLRPWAGTLFRFQAVAYPSPKEILSGMGARVNGGRWNPPGVSAIYGSSTDVTALEECKANDRYYGVITKGPRLLVALEVQVQGLLDLSDAVARKALGVTLKELMAEDWRKLMHGGKECLSQAIGRACAESGASGLLVRSASVAQGLNVVIFPGAHAGDRLIVVEGEKLKHLERGVKA